MDFYYDSSVHQQYEQQQRKRNQYSNNKFEQEQHDLCYQMAPHLTFCELKLEDNNNNNNNNSNNNNTAIIQQQQLFDTPTNEYYNLFAVADSPLSTTISSPFDTASSDSNSIFNYSPAYSSAMTPNNQQQMDNNYGNTFLNQQQQQHHLQLQNPIQLFDDLCPPNQVYTNNTSNNNNLSYDHQTFLVDQPFLHLSDIKSEPVYPQDCFSFNLNQQPQQQQQQQHLRTSKNATKKNVKEIRYGPLVVRPRRNPAPTLASGRKSKYVELTPDEEHKRELRRQRNRQAAEKCKRKRLEIEEQLNYNVAKLRQTSVALCTDLVELKAEKDRLERILETHICKPSPPTTTTTTINHFKSTPQTYQQQVNNNNNNYTQTYFSNNNTTQQYQPSHQSFNNNSTTTTNGILFQ